MPTAKQNHNGTLATGTVITIRSASDGDSSCCLALQWPAREGRQPDTAPPATSKVVSIGADEVRPIQRQLRLLTERNGH